MDTKIIKTVREWLPWSVEGESTPSEYAVLKSLAGYCQENITGGAEEKAEEVIKIISLLYSSGSLHEKNAIENEFLEVLAQSESPATLKAHLKLFPEAMKRAYLKTILEN